MLQLKLTGFIEEQGARIVKVDPKQLILQIGGGGFFGGWGKSQTERIPVRITMDLSDPPAESTGPGGKRLIIKATVEPVGRAADEELFRARAHHVVEQLRSHLMGS
jgi:hypothetical protein